MRALRAIFIFYIYGSIHVALAVCALVGVTWLTFGLEHDWKLLGFVFFGTVTGYNFVKYAGVAKFHHRSLVRTLRSIQLFSLLCFVALIWFAIKMPLNVLGLFGILGLLTFLYANPLLKVKSLRALSGVKIFVVALVWAGVTVLVPLLFANVPWDWDVWVTFVQRFIIVLVLTLPFEIRDMNYDAIALATLPQQWGIKNTKIMGSMLLAGVILGDFLKDEFHLLSLLILVMVCLLMVILLWRSQKKQSRYFASFWVESIPILWCMLLLLAEKLL